MKNIFYKPRNVYLSGCIFLVLVVGALIFAFFNREKVYKKEVSGKIIASVGSRNIYESELSERLNYINQSMGLTNLKLENLPPDIIKAMVLEVVLDDKILKDAKKMGFDKDRQILAILNEQKNTLIREKYIKDVIYSKATDELVKEKYDELVLKLKGKEERKIRHILLKTKDEAERVRRSIIRASDFERVASKKSIDTLTAQNGGDLGYLLKEELDSSFADVAFILKKGELSKPVESQFGWHIIRVDDIREAEIMPFEDVMDDLKNAVEQDLMQQFLKNETEKLDVVIRVQQKSLDEPHIEVEDKTQEDEVINENKKEQKF